MWPALLAILPSSSLKYRKQELRDNLPISSSSHTTLLTSMAYQLKPFLSYFTHRIASLKVAYSSGLCTCSYQCSARNVIFT